MPHIFIPKNFLPRESGSMEMSLILWLIRAAASLFLSKSFLGSDVNKHPVVCYFMKPELCLCGLFSAGFAPSLQDHLCMTSRRHGA